MLQLFGGKNMNLIKEYLNHVNIEENQINIITQFIKEHNKYLDGELLELFNCMVSLNIDFNIKIQSGYTVIKTCISNKQERLTEFLIKTKKITLTDDLLYLAIARDLPNTCRILIEYDDQNHINSKNCVDYSLFAGSTPLMLACYYNNQEIIELLIANKADPFITNDYNKYALMYSCDLKNMVGDYNYEIINLLIQNGSPINLQDNFGCTPLIYACRNINERTHLVITTLLEAGADPNIKDNNGNHALLNLIKSDLEYSLHLIIPAMITLIKYGADKNMTNKDGESIFDIMDDTSTMYFYMCNSYTLPSTNNKIYINNSCLICMNEKSKMVMFDFCKHAVVCFDCFQNLMEHSSKNDNIPKCPYCNATISTHTLVQKME